MLLSTHDLISWLSEKRVTKTYLVGTEGMREMLNQSGLETESEDPEYVVLGYDTEITYEKISTASIHLHKGVPLVSSHPIWFVPRQTVGYLILGLIWLYSNHRSKACTRAVSQIKG